MSVYFRDNLFSAGVTEILDEYQQPVGQVDLQGMFSSAIEVLGPQHELRCRGSFRFLSNKWHVMDGKEMELGVLRSRFAFFTKKFTYETSSRGSFEILSPAFSKEYEVLDESGKEVALFTKVNSWFSSPAFELSNNSGDLDDYELIAVIMGMNAIQKRQQSASAGNGAT